MVLGGAYRDTFEAPYHIPSTASALLLVLREGVS